MLFLEELFPTFTPPPFTPGVYYLEPLTLEKLFGLDSSDPKMNPIRKLNKKINEKHQTRVEAATKLFSSYDAIADQEREIDKRWHDLYNTISKKTVMSMTLKNIPVDWTEVNKAKKNFKKSYNRARQTMSDFQWEKRDKNEKSDPADWDLLNFETIHQHAQTLQQALNDHIEKISDAYKILLDKKGVSPRECIFWKRSLFCYFYNLVP